MNEVDRLLEMSVELAKTQISSSSVETSKIPELIQEIYRTLRALAEGTQAGDRLAKGQATAERRPGEAPVVNTDTSGPDFEGLDPWLAARVSRRIASQLNRDTSIHPSVFPDYLVCLEDGAKVKLLRSYLQNRHGLSVSEYLDRWNLPDNYPVAPPAFIEAKRAKAKASGLGVTTRGPRGPSKQRVPDRRRATRRSAKVDS